MPIDKPTLIAIVASLVLATSCKKEQPTQQTTASRPAATPSASGSATPSAAGDGDDAAGVTAIEAAVKAGEQLGRAVGVGGDRVVASAFKREGGEDKQPGSIFVFKIASGKATLETELKAENSNQLGNAIAFDGTVLIAGAMYDSGASA